MPEGGIGAEHSRHETLLAALVDGSEDAIISNSLDGLKPITMIVPPKPLRVLGDATRLTQAISNLLNNAAKYTPGSGQIGVSATRVDGHVALSVCDDGMGIAPALLPHVFGGSIEALSAGRDQGSEFRMQLPALTDDSSF